MARNMLVREAWEICHEGARNEWGRIALDEAIAVLTALGGDQSDIRKFLVLERVHRMKNPQRKDTKDDVYSGRRTI